MAIYFLDTSVVVKRYVQESGSGWIRTLTSLAEHHFFYIARITHVELTAALARRLKGQPDPQLIHAALAQFHKDFAQDYRVLEITIPVLQRAAALAYSHALRGYDAVQLACAMELYANAPLLSFISADNALNAAAASEGLKVENPGAYA